MTQSRPSRCTRALARLHRIRAIRPHARVCMWVWLRNPFDARASCARISTVRAGLAIVCLVGCVRDPVEAVCPDVSAGALVVTEVRGEQTPEDLDGPWIELFNATSDTIDLE